MHTEIKPSTTRARSLRINGTLAEGRLWYILRNRTLHGHKFVRQLPVGPYFADFACRAIGLIIELDGGQHNGSKSDEARTAYLNAQGYSVLRFWNNEVLSNRDGVFEAISLVIGGTPSPGLRYAPADRSRTGRGIRGARAASAASVARPAGKGLASNSSSVDDEHGGVPCVDPSPGADAPTSPRRGEE
jgi:very-short-patch-repair endonuclease